MNFKCDISLVFNPWFKETIMPSPDSLVYVPYGKFDEGHVMADMAFLTREAAETYFWKNKYIVTMSAQEFINRHLREIPAMNSFYELGRLEFLNKWSRSK